MLGVGEMEGERERVEEERRKWQVRGRVGEGRGGDREVGSER